MSEILKICDLKKSFKKRGQEPIHVIKGANLTINKGEMIALVAPSGSGKTTFLNMVGLLDTPSGGDIFFAGQNMTKASDGVKTAVRGRDIGFVYQFHHLLPEFSCLENIMLPQLNMGVSDKQARKVASILLDLVGLADKQHHKPGEISGGQQQRVAICRSLANNPKLLLADEPTGNLDPDTSEAIFEMLKEIIKQTGLSALIVTHDLDLAFKMDRVIKLKNGVLEDLSQA